MGAATRELLWGLRAVSREVDCWRRRAAAIPDVALREDALDALICKRSDIDGAALFWILPRHRSPHLLRLLARFEVVADFLDSADERAASVGVASGCCLQRALADALDSRGPVRDYYACHPWRDDGDYLRTLVDACRRDCILLPAYTRVRSPAIRAAELASVQALNHEPDPTWRAMLLQVWAARERPHRMQSSWFELTAAASAWLTVLALLALAAEASCEERDCEDAVAAYFWISMTATMLDSYADMADDAVCAGHSYVAYYGSEELAVQRLRELVRRSMDEVRPLRNGPKHAVIAACMVALYLSKDSARAPHLREQTRSLVHAGGSLTRLLLLVLRVWRTAYALRST